MNNFHKGKHDILQAIMEITDLRNISSRSVSSLFKEDVRAYFQVNKINVNPQIMLPGKSELTSHSTTYSLTLIQSAWYRLLMCLIRQDLPSSYSEWMKSRKIDRKRQKRVYQPLQS